LLFFLAAIRKIDRGRFPADEKSKSLHLRRPECFGIESVKVRSVQMKKVFLSAVIIAGSVAGFAHAQSGLDAAVASCTVVNAGTEGMTSFLNEARISGALNEDLITQAAVALGQAAGEGTSAAVRTSISGCLGVVAAASTDPARAAAIRQIAQTVVVGGTVATAAIGATAPAAGGSGGGGSSPVVVTTPTGPIGGVGASPV
jgi:hypothetical protein